MQISDRCKIDNTFDVFASPATDLGFDLKITDSLVDITSLLHCPPGKDKNDPASTGPRVISGTSAGFVTERTA